MKVYLERMEPEGDCCRCYAVQGVPTLCGAWGIGA